MYGLRPPDVFTNQRDVRVRKDTMILTNLDLHGLECHCDKQHEHLVAFGRVKHKGKWVTRTSLAAQYQLRLCQRWAALVAAAI